MEPRPVPVPGPPTAVARAARAVLAAFGWRADVVWPPVAKCVIAVYPHTSNWDFVIGYLAKLASGVPAHFMGKDALFRWPFGALFRRMGGIPVNRREHQGLIEQMRRQFERRSWMWLAVAPEGTRKYTDHWKSGFYRIALAAGVPVGLAFIDYRERVLGLRAYVTLTGDEATDLARIAEAYAGKQGRHPGQAAPIRFRA